MHLINSALSSISNNKPSLLEVYQVSKRKGCPNDDAKHHPRSSSNAFRFPLYNTPAPPRRSGRLFVAGHCNCQLSLYHTMYILFAFLLFSTRHHRNGVVIFILGPGIMSVGGRLTLHRRLLLYIIVILCSAAMLFCSFIWPLSCLLPLKWSIIQWQQLHGATPSHSFLSCCCCCSSCLVSCSAIRSLLPLTACLSIYSIIMNQMSGPS